MQRDLTIDQLPAELRAVQKRIQRATIGGLRKAAYDSRRATVEAINSNDPHPVVDLGQLKRSPTVTKLWNGAVLEVTAPHAAPQEYGTKPFTPPLSALIAWADRKLRRSNKGKAKAKADAAKAKPKKKSPKPKKAPKKRTPTGPSPEAKRMGGAVWMKIRREGITPKNYYAEASQNFDRFSHERIEEAVKAVKT